MAEAGGRCDPSTAGLDPSCSIQTSEDAAHYTSLPVLVTVPELLTPQEARIVPRRRKLILATAVVAMFLAIPTLALTLKLTQLFERFAI